MAKLKRLYNPTFGSISSRSPNLRFQLGPLIIQEKRNLPLMRGPPIRAKLVPLIGSGETDWVVVPLLGSQARVLQKTTEWVRS